MIPDVDDIEIIDTVVGEVASGSVLHVQLKEFGTNIQANICGVSAHSVSSVSSCERQPGDVVEGRKT